MKITIEGNPKEIAALVLEVQEQQRKATPEELQMLEQRSEAWKKIQSSEVSPP